MSSSISGTVRKKPLVVVLVAAVSVFLVMTAVPGVFTTDENNYNLAAARLRNGDVSVPGYAGLPYTHGARYFDPAPLVPRDAPDPAPPADFAIPPLHAVFALPFIRFGWYGLVALNVLALVAAAYAVYAYARAFANRPQTPIVALIAFTVGNFVIEYAQGTWPHMLSIGLVATGACCAALARQQNRVASAALAGVLLGAAVGVRFQNTVFLAGVLLTFLLARRWRLAGAAALATLPPLMAVSLLRFLRSGMLNPFVRRPGYLKPMLGASASDVPRWAEPLAVFWAKVVDYTTHPSLPGALHSYLSKDEATGAIMIGRSVKKAWIQSSPWVAIALVGMVLAWRFVRAADEREASRQRELRMLGVVLFPMLAALCIAGFARTDGGAFNQRYFLEMTPLAAIAFALLLERGPPLQRISLLGGAGVAALALAGMLWSDESGTIKIAFVMWIPVTLAAAGLLAWLQSSRWPRFLSVVVGASLAWAFTLHVLDDVQASRHQRIFNALRKNAVAGAFREPAAVFAYSYNKDALGPLQLEQDLLIFETGYDHLERLQLLGRALREQGRNVYVLVNDMPAEIAEGLIRAVGGGVHEQRYPVADGMQPLTILELGWVPQLTAD